VVLYQPVVNLRTRAISGFEAQLRWRHPERGLLAPSTFLPLADDIGLSRPIGEWLLRQACHDAAAWPEGGRLSLDLWPIQLTNPNLLTVVTETLRESGLTPSRLELEVVEQALLDNRPDTLATLHNLKALGVRIAMDKFGSGYSSLGYLRRFPFDKVKIDEASIAALGEKADVQAMVRAITGLCGSLGITTTAEGVATEEQCLLLADENCTEVQGTLFSAPCTAEEVARLYRLAGVGTSD
jgi:EAL domain-containing protein (putative c-di-GMP-specific phosphodiesterase class I)